jgi:hypothetical protein
VTLESALPYVSIGCAIGAAAAAAIGPSPGVQRTLKATALLALALFAFLRGIGPAAIALALVLGGLGWAAAPREPARRSVVSDALFTLAWLALTYLCLRAGGGGDVILQPTRLALALLAVIAVAGVIAWSRRAPDGPPPGWPAQTAALGLLLLASLTLRDDQWPAMAGVLSLLAAHAVALGLGLRPRPRLARVAEAAPWLLSYLGQAAVAYVFLR